MAREKAAKDAEEKQLNDLVEYYKIPEDQAAKLQTEPENVLPFLAARLHQTMAQSVQNLLATQLPAYIHQYTQVMAAETKHKDAFFGAWPQLKAYEQQVVQAGQLFRQLNPSADAETFIRSVGEIVTKSLGITIAAPAAPSAPAAPAAPAPAFAPAGGGGSGRAPVPASEENIFTTMALDSD